MRVLMLAWEYPPHVTGGMGKHVADLVPTLAAAGVDVSVITPQMRGGPASETLPSGARIFRVTVSAQEDSEFVPFVMAANRELELAALSLQRQHGKFDLLHTHDWLGTYAGTGLKRSWQIPLITTIHATERGRGRDTLPSSQAERINGLEWWLTYESWRIIVCSHFMANQVRDYFRAPFDKLDIIPNGIYIKPSPFARDDERLAFRRRYAADDQALVYFVGRIVYEKGPSVLLAAWPQVRATYPTARLVIAGSGDYLAAIQAQATTLGVSDSVIYTGFISDADRDRLYHVADMAVFPSLYEPFGIVALEAMAAHCPVVVSDTGGLSEVVQPHETGITFIPDYPGSLAWAIVHTLQHKDWATARAEKAFALIRDHYNWSQIASHTLQVYKRVHQEWLQNSWGKEPV